ncbi:penicillin-binding protein 2 [Conexibacter sp. JD483]|uniref:peptidoglycan D,D-transpeptidase FtsI family protein n=1 Tax=unclassified Conexibacter TaxID=2627773 RepID=UPI0027216C41|nr:MULTISPECIES: penicillin-binding protein 2 [unclassified Conexibacter]MDO8184625.1 penicillin-binding protein 2 [Conexibacter sp. CPCC 205706]MDO8197931.1 penicillin-binding protein 2 [Conexibacter sp. CPCC 205762]MDR9370104.1 penicillin-binding protein 2 [Conexibacter sp. JD483]
MPSITDRRIGLLFLVFVLALGAAFLRAGWLGAVKAPALKQAAATQQIQTVTLPAPRGTITDRTGAVLALSEAASDISATPYLVRPSEKNRTAAALAPLLQQDEADVLRKLNGDNGFVYLARRVPAARANAIKRLGIEGVTLTPSTLRSYPRDWLASQVLGSASEEPGGGSGLEYGEDRVLRGQDGVRRIVNDALGQAISVKDERPTVPGRDIQLTLDAGLQEKVESVLEGVGKTYRPRGATAIVMNPQTSEILALANWPRVDANDPGGAPAYAQQNRAVGMTFEPGSTFKAFTVAGALDDGTATPEKTYYLPTELHIADRILHDDHARGEETATVAQILAESSNIGAVRVALDMGARRFSQWVDRFGFGHRTGVSLPGEEIGLVPTYDDYSGSSIANLPIGQGQAVTPMQMMQAYAAIANGGVLREPRMIEKVGGVAVPGARGRRILSQQSAAEVREMLKGVLSAGGTAAEAAIPGYDLAGKTGTANKVDADTGEYSRSRYIASFMGFAPVRDPKLLVSVVVDEPQGSIYGGQVAAPAFQKIAAWALPYFGVQPN